MALERDVEAIAQDVLGVAFVNPEACELRLMDQNPPHVAPEEACQRAVRVWLLVGELMMPAVDGDPARGRFLQAGPRKAHHARLHPFRTLHSEQAYQQQRAKREPDTPAQTAGHVA